MMRISEKKADAIFFITILIAGTLVILLARGVPLVAGATTVPWASTYENWLYRSPIVISNPGTSTLTEWQVEIILNSTWTGWNYTTGADIRFALANGTTIPYWIQEWNSTAKKAIIWIKVPSIPAGGSTTVYMYFGNKNAVSESNGNAVFIFFDNFNEIALDTSKWINDGLGKVTVANGIATLVNDGSGHRAYLESVANITEQNISITARVKLQSTSATLLLILRWDGKHTASYDLPTNAIFFNIWSQTTALKYVSNGTVSSFGSISGFSNLTQYNTFTFTLVGKSAAAFENGVSLGSGTLTTLPPYYHIGLASRESYDAAYVDWVFVRKATLTPPTVKILSIEKNTYPVTFHITGNGTALSNVTAVINGKNYTVSNGTTLYLLRGLYNLTFYKPPKYSSVSETLNLTHNTTLNITMPIASYTLTFYAFYNKSTPVQNYQVYSGNTLLGTFNNSQHVTLKYGYYTLTFQKFGYATVTLPVNLTHDMNATFLTYKLNGTSTTFEFYNSQNNTQLNNVTITVANSTWSKTYTLNSSNTVLLPLGNFTITAKKSGFTTKTTNISLTSATATVVIYLTPSTSSTSPSTTTSSNAILLPSNLTGPPTFNTSNNTPFVGARVFNYLASFRLDKAFPAFLHLNPLFAIFIPLILTLGISVASWYFTHNGLVVLGVLAISGTFWYLAGINLQLSLLQPLAIVVIFFIAWAIWSFYRTKEAGE